MIYLNKPTIVLNSYPLGNGGKVIQRDKGHFDKAFDAFHFFIIIIQEQRSKELCEGGRRMLQTRLSSNRIKEKLPLSLSLFLPF